MQTRHKSKLAEDNPGTSGSNGGSSNMMDEDVGAPSLPVQIPEEFDTDTLQALLPDFNLATPTTDAIMALYQLVLQQRNDLDETSKERDLARADISRYEVELDQALQDQDVQASQLRASLEEAQSDLVKSRNQIAELGL